MIFDSFVNKSRLETLSIIIYRITVIIDKMPCVENVTYIIEKKEIMREENRSILQNIKRKKFLIRKQNEKTRKNKIGNIVLTYFMWCKIL